MVKESPEPRFDEGAPRSFKSLIRFGNVTYRIARLSYGNYEVVRILDDVQMGTFRSYPCLTVTTASIHPSFILKIAQAAARAARPSWIERLAVAMRRKSEIRPRTRAEIDENPDPSAEDPDSLQNPRERG
jgi:hypothetical protein